MKLHQISVDNFLYATEKLKRYSGSFPRAGAFEQLFGPVRSEFEPYFSKNSNAQGFARGDVEASI